MALFDFLKRKKEVEKAKEGKKEKPAQKARPVEADKKPKQEPKPVAQPVSRAKKTSGFAYNAVKQPHISEKATYLAEKDQYIFEISPNYNKNEVKKAVEGLYNVDVLSVNIVKIPAKKRRLGKTQGFKKGMLKAVVRIKQGQKIEIL